MSLAKLQTPDWDPLTASDRWTEHAEIILREELVMLPGPICPIIAQYAQTFCDLEHCHAVRKEIGRNATNRKQGLPAGPYALGFFNQGARIHAKGQAIRQGGITERVIFYAQACPTHKLA